MSMKIISGTGLAIIVIIFLMIYWVKLDEIAIIVKPFPWQYEHMFKKMVDMGGSLCYINLN